MCCVYTYACMLLCVRVHVYASMWYFPQMPSILHVEMGSHPELSLLQGLLCLDALDYR